MAIIRQITFFRPDDVLADLGDLKRLQLVLDILPDEPLMMALERVRGKSGRNDYPIRMMWNLFIAGIIFQHPTTASLLRELSRNSQLRYVVSGGHMDSSGIPSEDAMSRFSKRLMQHQDLLDAMFESLVESLRAFFPDLGQRIAIDSKMIESTARRRSSSSRSGGRGEHDAEVGAKTYQTSTPDGGVREQTRWYFGYKLHLLVDSVYEIPLAFRLSTARPHDLPEGRQLVDDYAATHPELYESCEVLTADRGYASQDFVSTLADDGITAVIDIPKLWKTHEKPLLDLDNLTYNENGEVFCCCPHTGMIRTMSNNGYEAKRDCIRKQCPMVAYKGMICEGYDSCLARSGIRIPLTTDPRVFTSLPRDGKKWMREYALRTSVERVNSRFDVSYGFETHLIRGKKKMHLRVSLALIVMLAKTLAHVNRQPLSAGEYNSLVKMPA